MAARKTSPKPEETPEETPETEVVEETPDLVEVQLVGGDFAVLGTRQILRGETRTVSYHDYVVASSNNPDSYLVRRVGEGEYRKSL